jgi:hypothetical protein
MIRSVLVAFVASACPACVQSPVALADPADLDAYLEEIRESGMTEMARASLRAVAGVYLGHLLLEYRLDEASGRYWPSYRSTVCANPAADPNEGAARQEEVASQRLAAQIAEDGRVSIAALGRASGLSGDEARERYLTYTDVVKRERSAGAGVLPLVEIVD